MDDAGWLGIESLKNGVIDANSVSLLREYVAKYHSDAAANSFVDACKTKNFDEAQRILAETQERVKNVVSPQEYQRAQQEAQKIIEGGGADTANGEGSVAPFDNQERSKRQSMDTSGGTIALVVLGFVAAMGIGYALLKHVAHEGPRANGNPSNVGGGYTAKDKDFMALIHELATIYANTDKFLNS